MSFLSCGRNDLILHLATAALGAEEFYTLENNAARFDANEEAVSFDIRTQLECTDHPNFEIIDNRSGVFEKKLDAF